MKEGGIFKIAVLAAFIGFAVLGVITLATFKGGGGSASRSSVTVWGTVDHSVFDELDRRYRSRTREEFMINYVRKDPASFEIEYINALALGRGPDIILAPPGFIFKNRETIFTIPYSSFSERAIRDTFIEQSETLLTSQGILGVPFSIDPLVLYYNRDILSNNNIAGPPSTWDEIMDLSDRLSVVDANYNIIQSAISLGEYGNVNNAKSILAALFLQVGNRIISFNNDNFTSLIQQRVGDTTPTESALRFYTDFSDPAKSIYSWNRAMPNSQNVFLAGDLAFYIGRASEVEDIIRRNPNLNFDVSILPQIDTLGRRTTYGLMTSLAIVRNSRNIPSAYMAMLDLTSTEVQQDLSEVTGLPPIRRNLLAIPQPDAINAVFYESALLSRGWIDPDPASTDRIFSEMVSSVTSGRVSVSQAISRAGQEIEALIRSFGI